LESKINNLQHEIREMNGRLEGKDKIVTQMRNEKQNLFFEIKKMTAKVRHM